MIRDPKGGFRLGRNPYYGRSALEGEGPTSNDSDVGLSGLGSFVVVAGVAVVVLITIGLAGLWSLLAQPQV